MKNYPALIVFLLVTIIYHPVLSMDKEQRNVGSFNAVHVGSGIDLFIYQDDQQKVVVESDSNIDDIITEVENGVLIIRYKKNNQIFKWGNEDKVFVYVPGLKEIKCSGGSDAETMGQFKTDMIILSASGGSDLKVDLRANEIEVDCSGGSDAIISGTSRKLKAHTSGGSDLKGYDLTVDEADLQASGGSDIQITVNKKMVANASGGSDIYYKGNPEFVNVNSSSGSDINKR
jgi:hypothetical protein